MRKQYFILLLLFISASSTGQEKKQFILKNEVELKHYVGEGYKRIAISEEEMKVADSLASKYVVENNKGNSITGRIDYYYDYYRQYAGYKNSSPEKIIFINAFIRYNNELPVGQLENILYDTRGGGASYFKIKVNLDKKECFDFRINAPK